MATWHSKDPAERVNFKSSWSDGGVDTYFLSIFLALHVDDSPHGVSSNKHNFDAFWPAQYVDRDEPILSTVSSMTSQRPTTPSKHLTAPPSTPQSPRSPKSNPSPQSPKRSTTPTGSLSVQHGTPHQVRSSAQHLYSLKQKLPFILKVLSTDEVLDDINRSPINDMDEPIINPTRSAQEFVVSRQALDSLGLILSGGTTRAEESKSKLSNLHSLWSSDDMNNSFESSGRREGVCFSELSMWIDDLLVMNDVLYPTSSGAATGPRMSHVSLGGVGLVTGADARTLSTPRGMSPRTSYEETGSPRTFVERLPQPPVVHNPLRHIMSSSSIHANLPSVVRHFASTLLYTTAASSDNSGQIPPSSSDTSLVDIDRMRTSQDDLKELLRKESKSVDQKASSSSTSSSSSNLSVLPQALITGCVGAHLYLLSSYSTATISSSHDCEIVIGAVAGAIILSACERVTLTVACRKLVVVGCLDCKINVASMSANVITGECRGLLFGK